jgi:hypothetical protein
VYSIWNFVLRILYFVGNIVLLKIKKLMQTKKFQLTLSFNLIVEFLYQFRLLRNLLQILSNFRILHSYIKINLITSINLRDDIYPLHECLQVRNTFLTLDRVFLEAETGSSVFMFIMGECILLRM